MTAANELPRPLPLFLTTAEVAAITGWWQDTAAAYVRTGRLRGYKRGRDWLIETASLEQYLSLHLRPGRKPGVPQPRKKKKPAP